ncbi:MAG: hypothetical protein JST82_04895 [Bacteroidetes bacterium]|nr:hypothetical protein [Bacteroidota bacterium]
MKTLVKSIGAFELMAKPLNFKREILLFDKICYEYRHYDALKHMNNRPSMMSKNLDHLDFLLAKGLMELSPNFSAVTFTDIENITLATDKKNKLHDIFDVVALLEKEIYTDISADLETKSKRMNNAQLVNYLNHISKREKLLNSHQARLIALYLSLKENKNYVSIYETKLINDNLPVTTTKEEVLAFILNKIPILDLNTTWEAILEYKSDEDAKRKYYALIDWVNEVANSNMTISEIEDKYNYLYHEYEAQLKLHRLKTTHTRFEVVVNTVAGIAENLVRFKFSDISKALFSINKDQLDLMEAETKITGRELGYIYDVNKKFGTK